MDCKINQLPALIGCAGKLAMCRRRCNAFVQPLAFIANCIVMLLPATRNGAFPDRKPDFTGNLKLAPSRL
jgi:hypothetical protein